MGTVLAALSPTVTLALINETGSEGPISETVLGVVVLADLAIIFTFAAVNALANSAFGAAGGESIGGVARELMVHIFGSLAMGAVLGIIIALYMKKLNARIALFIFGICFLSAEAGVRLHLDPLLMCLAAGLFLENLTEIEGGSSFTTSRRPRCRSSPCSSPSRARASTGILFRSVAVIAISLAVIRGVALVLGARFGMAMGLVPTEQRKTIPYGLLSQSGVAIGLSILVEKHFPGRGKGRARACSARSMVNEMGGAGAVPERV